MPRAKSSTRIFIIHISPERKSLWKTDTEEEEEETGKKRRDSCYREGVEDSRKKEKALPFLPILKCEREVRRKKEGKEKSVPSSILEPEREVRGRRRKKRGRTEEFFLLGRE